jgi:hypothetical protein
MALRGPAVLRAAIGEDPVHGNLVLLEERQDAIIEEISGRDRRLAVIRFGKPDLAIVSMKVC